MFASNSVAEVAPLSLRGLFRDAVRNSKSMQERPCDEGRCNDGGRYQDRARQKKGDFKHASDGCDPRESPIETRRHELDYAQSAGVVP